MISFFYIINIALLASSLLALNIRTGQGRYSLGLIQVVLAIPLLSAEYLYVSSHLDEQAVQLILFSELIFTIIWLFMALHMKRAVDSSLHFFQLSTFLEILTAVVIAAAGYYFLVVKQPIHFDEAYVAFSTYDFVFFTALFTLAVMLFGTWQLELFFRKLSSIQRWEYKFFIIGAFLIAGAAIWYTSYRLTYIRIVPKHFLLLSLLYISGGCMYFPTDWT